jgi:2'-5' RNA ligase
MRVFAALPLPDALCGLINEGAILLKKRCRGLRTVNDNAMHITVHFFGEIDRERVELLSRLMDEPSLRQDRFNISLGPLGWFPPRGRPRVLFYTLAAGGDRIMRVYSVFRDLIADHGWPRQADERAFTPHLTVARNKFEYVEPEVMAGIPVPAGSFSIDRLVLFQSILKPGGAEHVPLKTVEFVG